jgi:hypothetical protein
LYKTSNVPINSTEQQTNSPVLSSKALSPSIASPQNSLQSTPPEQVSQTFNIKPQISLSPQASDLEFSLNKSTAVNSVGDFNSENILDFSKPPLYGRVNINTAGQNQEDQQEQKKEPNVFSISTIQSKGIKTLPFDIKPEPEPKPTIIYQKSITKQSGSNSVPLKTGSASNVPIIASSNSDNMYTLYSQASYNVIV